MQQDKRTFTSLQDTAHIIFLNDPAIQEKMVYICETLSYLRVYPLII